MLVVDLNIQARVQTQVRVDAEQQIDTERFFTGKQSTISREMFACLPAYSDWVGDGPCPIEKIIAVLKQRRPIKPCDKYCDEKFSSQYQYWDCWTGSGNIRYITPQACIALLEYHAKFQDGIDLDHLPSGFYLSRGILDYDAGYANAQIENNKLSPFSVRIVEAKNETEEDLLYKNVVNETNEKQWYTWLIKADQEAKTGQSTAERNRAWRAFIKRLEEFELKLPTLPNRPLAVKNMLVALGRMTSFLENCRPIDKQKQLELLPSLDLSSRGAIQAIYYERSAGKFCHFVTPEMTYSANAYSANDRTINDFFVYIDGAPPRLGTSSYRNPHDLSDEHFTRSFWWHVALKPDPLSIDFYQRAIDIIKNSTTNSSLSLSQKGYLYNLLTFVAFVDDAPSSLIETSLIWEEFCYAFVTYYESLSQNNQGVFFADLKEFGRCEQLAEHSMIKLLSGLMSSLIGYDVERENPLNTMKILLTNVDNISNDRNNISNDRKRNRNNVTNDTEQKFGVYLERVLNQFGEKEKNLIRKILLYVPKDSQMERLKGLSHLRDKRKLSPDMFLNFLSHFEKLLKPSEKDTDVKAMLEACHYQQPIIFFQQLFQHPDFHEWFEHANNTVLPTFLFYITKLAPALHEKYKSLKMEVPVTVLQHTLSTMLLHLSVAMGDEKKHVEYYREDEERDQEFEDEYNEKISIEEKQAVSPAHSGGNKEWYQQDLIVFIHSMTNSFPGLSDDLLSSLRLLSESTKDAQTVNNYVQTLQTVCLENIKDIDENSVKITFKACIERLFYHLHENPTQLQAVLNKLKNVKEEARTHALHMIGIVLDQNPSLDLSASDSRLDSAITFPDQIKKYYVEGSPPYPSLKTFHTLIAKDEKDKKDEKTEEGKFEEFSKNPYGKRIAKYGVKQDQFEAPLKKFYRNNPHLSENDLSLKKATGVFFEEFNIKGNPSSLHHLSAQALYDKIDNRNKTISNPTGLISYVTEVLARTASQHFEGRDDYDEKDYNGPISRELNATQLMAVSEALQLPEGKVVSQLNTGEGKTRINMVLAACLALQGETVDFITNNFYLAKRDYYQYNTFFKALGIQTSLIDAASHPSTYADVKGDKGGVNFSDITQLSLARNQQAKNGEKAFYPESGNATLVLDEADVVFYDFSSIRFNSAKADPNLKNMHWIYPRLVAFLDGFEDEKVYLNALNTMGPFPDASPSSEEQATSSLLQDFKDRLSTMISTREQAALNKISDEQITIWLQAAWDAKQLVEGQDFSVTPKAEAVCDVYGNIVYKRLINVVMNARVLQHSSFSNGVAQCLLERLNQVEKSRSGHAPYAIRSPQEGVIDYTSSSYDFVKGYSKVYGVTGSYGSRSELYELKKKFGIESMLIPPERPTKRKVHRPWIAKDKAHQEEILIRRMREVRERQTPVLLICKDDEEVAAFHQLLSDQLELPLESIQKIDSQTDDATEKACIEKAGNLNSITVATEKLGRGTDIRANNLVLFEVSPAEIQREQDQRYGRVGRFGKKGSVERIYNVDALGVKKTYSYEKAIMQQRRNNAILRAENRYIDELFSIACREVQDSFYNSLHNTTEEIKVELENEQEEETWSNTLKIMEARWAPVKDAIKVQLQCKDKVRELLTAFIKMHLNNAPLLPNDNHYEERIPYYFDDTYKKLVKEESLQYQITLQKDYEGSEDGQATRYSTLFAQTRAFLSGNRRWFANIRAWREERGVLFADTRAMLSGDRPLFANIRATVRGLFQSNDTEDALHPVSINANPLITGDEKKTEYHSVSSEGDNNGDVPNRTEDRQLTE